MLMNDTTTVPVDVPDAPPSVLSRPDSAATSPDGAPNLRVVEDCATESGMTVQEFEDAYFEQCVAELADGHPAVRQFDAERLVLNDAFWPAAHAA